MVIDTGKDAKRMGRMKPQEARHIDQDPLRVPPHKKPRKYRLTVSYTTTLSEVCEKEFASKAAMQEFRARVEREIAKEKAAASRKTNRYWGAWIRGQVELKMEATERKVFTFGPVIVEELLDG